MSVDWITMVPSIVYTRIITEFSEAIKNEYKMTDKNFSTIGTSDTTPVFPFVYIGTLPGKEEGKDLDGIFINGGTFAFQIDVTDKIETVAPDAQPEFPAAPIQQEAPTSESN